MARKRSIVTGSYSPVKDSELVNRWWILKEARSGALQQNCLAVGENGTESTEMFTGQKE